MRTYEALYIVTPEMEDNAIHTVVAEVEQLIVNGGGTIVRSDVWGRRKLAYPIHKHIEGVYVVLRFTANPDFIKRFEQQMKLLETVIRHMVLYLDEQTLKLEAEQQRQYEEDLRSSASRRGRHDDDDDDDDDYESDPRIPTRRIVEDDFSDDDIVDAEKDDETDEDEED